MTEENMRRVLEIGVMLSAERDIGRLMEKILQCVMELAECDAGTVYLLEGGALHFRIMRNNTLGTCAGGDGREPDLPPVPMRRENVCALALMEGRTLLIDDVYESDICDFSGPRSYDAITGYRTRSMLVVPMVSREGEKLGVIQLINAMDRGGNVRPFREDMALVLESVASQAAITVRNVRYIRQIRELFHSFVRMLSAAVDERTPYNASHSRHMAAYGERFIDYLDRRGIMRIDAPRREELIISIWLHDIGKLVTPLEVMNKAARLRPEQRAEIQNRLEVIALRGEIRELRGELTAEEHAGLLRDIEDARALIDEADTAGFQTDGRLEALEALARREYTDARGAARPWLTPEELSMLSIRRGTLSPRERKIMEHHVELTDSLLSKISFPEDLRHVRDWASRHHEYLNGTGYPRGLRGEEIPPEVRIITILDVFDALSAPDRPYKKGMPVERALGILSDMARKEGKLDVALTDAFIESRCWETEIGEAVKR